MSRAVRSTRKAAGEVPEHENFPGAFVRLRADGRVAVANARARALLADTGELVPGAAWAGFLPEEEAARFHRLAAGLAVGATAAQTFSFGRGAAVRRLRANVLRLPAGIGCTLQGIEEDEPTQPVFLGQTEVWLPGDFLGQLTHELKNHLSAAQAASFLLRSHGRDLGGTKELQWMGAIKQAVVSLREVMEQLDTLERVQRELPVVGSEPIEVSAWLNELVDRNRTAVLASAVQLEVGSEIKGGWRLGDALLAVALKELVINALKFGPAGSQARVEARVVGGELEFVVADAGPGVLPGEVERLFHPFFQGQNARGRAGSGLGLATARIALTRLGGAVTYRRTPERGTEFVVRVPVQPKR